ncbi:MULTISPECIES: DUF7858 family protein [Halolamina]|uniref:Uncharacterized protein n=1 Tax=Halolamina pelagica TaxID=699431 RepID=A0A1I5SAY1_9EURY|nr:MULTISPECIES: hypothetical protein [Halolamina]NHX37144.1 hypothetical protein [Halolamina sp. R1-12]SFP67870.1 hypothetical protein SAMN05216277_10631 [Halolamina pelagica]
MTLDEIAAGIEVTAEQEARGVAAVDETGTDLVERLRDHAAALPCTPEAAATVVETHAAGTSVGESAREAGIAPVTAAKALHRCGVSGVTPLSPIAREIVRDWQAGELSRAEAIELAGVGEAEFALGSYIESHEPDPDLSAAVADVGSPTGRKDPLADAVGDVDELF